MGKKQKTVRRQHRQIKTKSSGVQIGAILPALIIILAVLWDWAMRLSSDGWHGNPDISTFMFLGQHLTEGVMIWTQQLFDDKLLVIQLLFSLPALLGSYKVWYLMSMGACLAGAYSVYVIVRDVFSPTRGFPGFYAGLYGGVFTLYLSSVPAHEPHHINTLTVSMALVAAVLMKRSVGRSGVDPGTAVFLVACFCASLAVGLRPYLFAFIGLIPLWVSMAAQIDNGDGRIDYRSVAKLFLLWNTCVGLFLLCVNVLPYVITGELGSFIAGIEVMREKVFPEGMEWIWKWMIVIYKRMGLFSTLLFFSWTVFVVLFLIGLAGRFYKKKAASFELLTLAIIAPFSIFAVIVTRHFWPHYAQFLLPFIGIGAMSLFALVYDKHYLRFLFRYKVIAVIPALLFMSPAVTELWTKPRHHYMVPTVQNLSALLDQHGLEKGDFLAPYNDYVHVKLNQHKHRFPSVAVSVSITIKGLLHKAKFPDKFGLPRNSLEYCQMLDSSGPKLIVFFKDTTFIGYSMPPTHLAYCNLRHYDRYDLSDKARFPSDIAYYFIRR